MGWFKTHLSQLYILSWLLNVEKVFEPKLGAGFRKTMDLTWWPCTSPQPESSNMLLLVCFIMLCHETTSSLTFFFPFSSTHSVPIMPTHSSTSTPTTRPSYASCAATSSNSSTALIRCAGGAVAMDMWATSPRSTSNPFTTANDLTSIEHVHQRTPALHAAPLFLHLPNNFLRSCNWTA